MHEVYLSLGSNLGNKKENIRQAMEKIKEQVGDIVRQSALYDTAPWGFSSENRFVNAAVCCHTPLSPHEVLAVTQRIERELGRSVKSADGQYHDRPIDIDILLFDDIEVNDADLKIPHPLMTERDFVMIPLREILTS